MVPSSSFRKRTAETLQEVLKRHRHAGDCLLRDHDREYQRNIAVGDSIEGEQLQRQLGQGFYEAQHNDFKLCFIFLRRAG